MKICPACQENNHDAAELCLLCGAPLPAAPGVSIAPVSMDHGEEVLLPAAPPEPPAGSVALAVYHDTVPHIVAYFVVETDTMLIGREDPGQGIFPDLDLERLARYGVGASHVSRRHARLTRCAGELTLVALAGSTGTQLNRQLLRGGERATVRPGDRIILGGRVRMKLMRFA